MDEALLSISRAGRGQLVKMLITLEPHGTFGSNLAYLKKLFILTLSSHWYKNGNEDAGWKMPKNTKSMLKNMPIVIINNNNI